MCWADLLVAFSIDIGANCVSSQDFAVCSVSEACRVGLAISSTGRLHVSSCESGAASVLETCCAKMTQRLSRGKFRGEGIQFCGNQNG